MAPFEILAPSLISGVRAGTTLAVRPHDGQCCPAELHSFNPRREAVSFGSVSFILGTIVLFALLTISTAQAKDLPDSCRLTSNL